MKPVKLGRKDSMNLEELRQRLVVAARHAPVDSSVPTGFERRVAAAIHGRPRPDPWLAWLQGLRRAAFLASSIAVVAMVLHLVVPARTAAVPGDVPEPDPLGEAVLADISGLLDESLMEEASP